MRNASPTLSQHLQGEVTTLATCWLITRSDGIILGFTDHDKDIAIDSHTYLSIAGFTPSSIESKDNLSVDNLDIHGVLHEGYITAPDLLTGKYDFAEVEIFLVNYEHPEHGKMLLKRGRIGEVTIQNGGFIAELRGLAEALQKTIGHLYQPSCRAILGDTKCQVPLAGFTITGQVMHVTSTQLFTINTPSQPSGYFTGGEITWITGLNHGLRMEIKEHIHPSITLALPMPYSIQLGDNFELIAGCDKTHITCKNTFNNIINFRGEPFIPGMDAIAKTAGTLD